MDPLAAEMRNAFDLVQADIDSHLDQFDVRPFPPHPCSLSSTY